MGSGGPSNSTSTTTNAPWGPAGHYGRMWLPDIWNYISGTGPQPSLRSDPFPNQQVAGFTPDQMTAFGMTDLASGNLTGLLSGADANAQATLGGTYLNPSTNPYLDQTYNAAATAMGNQFKYNTAPNTMGRFASAGGYGDSAFNDAMAANDYSYGNNLADLGARIYGGNYQRERRNELNVLNNVSNLAKNNYIPAEALLGSGGMQQSQAQNVANTDYQNSYNQAMFPFQALQMLGSAVSQMGSMGGSTISTAPFLGSGKGI